MLSRIHLIVSVLFAAALLHISVSAAAADDDWETPLTRTASPCDIKAIAKQTAEVERWSAKCSRKTARHRKFQARGSSKTKLVRSGNTANAVCSLYAQKQMNLDLLNANCTSPASATHLQAQETVGPYETVN